MIYRVPIVAAVSIALCACNAHAESKRPADPYAGLGPTRDRILEDYREATIASAAFFCRFRSLEWMSERNDMLNRDALTISQNSGVLSSIQLQQVLAWQAWYSAAGSVGVPQSDCIDLHDSEALKRLDDMPGTTLRR